MISISDSGMESGYLQNSGFGLLASTLQGRCIGYPKSQASTKDIESFDLHGDIVG